jgi:hypothetical protein
MKYILLLFIVLTYGTLGFSQQSVENDFKGNWISVSYKDTIRLHVLNSNRILVQLHSNVQMGIYRYEITSQYSDLVLIIKSVEKKTKDSLIIILTKVNAEEYKIKSIIAQYYDRPPEHWLEEGKSYTLFKENNL